MASSSTARVKYLNEGAHLLAINAPTTAAILQYRLNALESGDVAFDAVLDPNHESQGQSTDISLPKFRHLDVCSSCGFQLSTQGLKLAKRVKRTSADSRSPGTTPKKQLYIDCAKCNAQTFEHITRTSEKRHRSSSKKDAITASVPPSKQSKHTIVSTAIEKTELPKIDASNSRKRSKTRKGNSLSAMLAKSKQDAASRNNGFGLDLMDFMTGS